MPKESKSAKIQRAAAIVARLKERYPNAECALQYEGEPWRLLVMGRLSAQCTDARVNIVCQELFDRFPTPRAMADGSLRKLRTSFVLAGCITPKPPTSRTPARGLWTFTAAHYRTAWMSF